MSNEDLMTATEKSLLGPARSSDLLLKVAMLELNLLNSEKLLPPEFEGAYIADQVKIMSADREELYRTVMLLKRSGEGEEESVGFFDFATNPVYGGVLLAVGVGDGTFRASGLQSALSEIGEGGNQGELISYGYPKIGLRAGEPGEPGEPGQLRDIFSNEGVLEDATRQSFDPLGYLELYRMRDIISLVEFVKRKDRFDSEVAFWEPVISKVKSGDIWGHISASAFKEVAGLGSLHPKKPEFYGVVQDLSPRQELDLLPQRVGQWCFPACVEMLLSYYRFRYSQELLAFSLGLGDIERAMPLPRSTEYDVVRILERMTRGVLKGRMTRAPEWQDVRDEIRKRRPVIGLIHGHCRLIVGASLLDVHIGAEDKKTLALRGLSLHDPWPVEGGARIYWENFDAVTYVAMFVGELETLSEKELGFVDELRLRAELHLTNSMEAGELPRSTKVGTVERVGDATEGSDSWIVGIEEGKRLIGVMHFKKDLTFGGFRSSVDGSTDSELTSRVLDRQLAREEVRRIAAPGDRVSEPELSFEDESTLIWRAEAKHPGLGQHEIKLENLRFKAQRPE